MSMEKFLSSLSEEQKDNLKQLLDDDAAEEEKETPKVNEDFVVNRSTSNRRTQVRAGKNQWADTSGDFKDVETPDGERTPRVRKRPKKEPVECHVCGKSFKADPRYLYGEYYRCNKCTGR